MNAYNILSNSVRIKKLKSAIKTNKYAVDIIDFYSKFIFLNSINRRKSFKLNDIYMLSEDLPCQKLYELYCPNDWYGHAAILKNMLEFLINIRSKLQLNMAYIMLTITGMKILMLIYLQLFVLVTKDIQY